MCVKRLAPRQPVRKKNKLCGAMARKTQSAKKPVVEEVPDEEETGRHLKRFSLEFLAEVAAACQLPTNDVRKVLEGLRKTLLKQIRDKSTTRIPNIAMLRVKTLKARPATKKLLFGVEKEMRAKPETTKVMCTALKAFKIDCRA